MSLWHGQQMTILQNTENTKRVGVEQYLYDVLWWENYRSFIKIVSIPDEE